MLTPDVEFKTWPTGTILRLPIHMQDSTLCHVNRNRLPIDRHYEKRLIAGAM